MHEPIYQLKLERMVPDQKEVLIGAAYGDSGIWTSFATLYQFAVTDQAHLRSYIRKTYRSDGSHIPEPVLVARDGLSGREMWTARLAVD